MRGAERIPVKITKITQINELVKRFQFERIDGGSLPIFSAGAHTVVEMQDGNTKRLNPYSLMSDPYDPSFYAVSVLRNDDGRGGSLFMHKHFKVGDETTISYPVNLFSLDLRARKHLFFAGGIGITPFLAQILQLEASNGFWELHYGCRSKSLSSYADELIENYPTKTHVYYLEESQKIDLDKLLKMQAVGTHLYVCGPKGMINWVCDTAFQLGWPKGTVHYEEFIAPKPGKPFKVRLASSQKTINVGEHESFLEAMERKGVEAPYLCRGGSCGQCEVEVIDCEGDLIHLDHWLTEEDRAMGKKIMPCVSRFEGKKLVIKL